MTVAFSKKGMLTNYFANSNKQSWLTSTPPFLQNMFVAWNSHGVDVFLEHCVDVDGILWRV